MSREYRKRGAPLPDPLTGYAVRRFCLELPDNLEYQSAAWGQLWELGQEYFWQKTGPEDQNPEFAAQMWRDLLAINRDRWAANEACDITDLCLTYPNTASFISYYPNDPRYTPDLVPEGYNLPPWYFPSGADNVLFGTQTGDIITSLLRFPPGSLPTIIPASGLPTIAINVTGAGRITVNLRTMYAGSKIQITRDNDPLTAYYVDVLRDIISIPPTSVTEIAVDIDFATPGDHVAHLVVVSSINDAAPFLHHGAGLISVELCGLMPTIEEPIMYGAIRVNGCDIEQYNTSTQAWELVANANYLPVSLACALTGHILTVRSETNQPGLIVTSPVVKPFPQAVLGVATPTGNLLRVFEPGLVRIDNFNEGAGQTNPHIDLYARKAVGNNDYGTLIRWLLNSSTSAQRYAGGLGFSWYEAADATRKPRFNIQLQAASGGGFVYQAVATGPNTFLQAWGGNAPIAKPDIGGFTVDGALTNLINAFVSYGLISSTIALPANAPIVLIQQNGCGIQFSIDGTIWDDMSGVGFLPLVADDACNAISLQNVPLELQRVGGSTESANTLIKLSAVGESGLSPLPLAITFEEQTDTALHQIAYVEAKLIDSAEATYKSEIAMVAHDSEGGKAIMRGQAYGTHSRAGFLGAQPVSRQTINYGDLTDRELALAIGQALENFGFLNFIPCAPEFGDWAIEWRNIQLTAWPQIDCAIYDFDGLTTQPNCWGLDAGFGADLNWTQSNASFLVYAEIDISWNGITATGFNFTLAADPGVGQELLVNEYRYDGSGGETITWTGDEDFGNIGMSVDIQAAGAGSVTVTRVKLEGYGDIPTLEGGLLCS